MPVIVKNWDSKFLLAIVSLDNDSPDGEGKKKIFTLVTFDEVTTMVLDKA